MVFSMLRQQLLRKSMINVPEHFIIKKLARFLSRVYKQLKYIVRIKCDCDVECWRGMKIPQCYFSMKLRLVQRKTVWLFV